MAEGASHLNGNLGAHAAACVAAGLCALPAVRRGEEKRVALRAWKPYQTRLPTHDEVGSWFAPSNEAGRSLCLVCGSVSGNLEMIDFELGGEAFEAWREAVESACPGLVARLVIESTPSGGRHVIYRCEAPVSGSTKLASSRIVVGGEVGDGEPVVIGSKEYEPRRDAGGSWVAIVTLIETRGEGGLFLCAPSEGYEIVQGDLCRPPLITPDERDVLLGCAWALDEAPAKVVGHASAPSTHAGGLRPGDDFNERGDPRDVLLRHGWALAKAGDNEYWRRPGKAAGTSATLKDRVFYVFSTNAAPFEAHKGYSPFAVYALLEHDGDFAAAASALSAQGYGQAANDTQGVDLSAFITERPPTNTSPVEPSPLPVRDLVAAYPLLRPPVIHGLLREGETMNVIASPKTGKSWLTLDLAIAVATGRPWLERYETVSGPVLIIDNELHRETSAHRIPKVAQARGVAMREIDDRIFVDNLRGRLRDIFTLAPYFQALEPGRFRVIVLDAFYRFMPAGGDENDNGTMANIYNAIDAFADRLGCCFVLIHHSTKGSQSAKSVTDVGAGAGAQSRATDTHLVLRPHEDEGVVVLDAAVRSWPPIAPTCLRWKFPVWTVADGLDPGSLRSEKPGKKKEPANVKAETPKSEPWTVERFVEAFISGEPVSLAELRERAAPEPGLSWRRVSDLLSIAEGQGLIERVRLPGRGGRWGYVLPSEETVR
ncbi:MAG: AAA family ATPase [Phycisphaeraceae bacterium]|nr:AAA family ATPase [Phycisphaeraceae bacterium]